MKNLVFRVCLACLGSLLLLVPRPVKAQSPQLMVKIAPLKLFSRGVDVSAEYALSNLASVGVGFQYTIPWNAANFVENLGITLASNNFGVARTTLTGWKVTPEMRYYFGESAPEGIYVAGFLRAMNYRLETEGTVSTTVGPFNGTIALRMLGVGPGISLGNQWVFANGVVVDWHVGGGVTFNGLRVSGQFNGAGADELQSVLDEVNRIADQVPFVNPPDIEVIDNEFGLRVLSTPYPVFRTGLSIGLGV